MVENYPISRATLRLLGQRLSFFDSVASINHQYGLGLRGQDPEARIVSEQRSDGKLAVTLIYPLDDNEKIEDGRLYLKDEFILDSQGKSVESFRRYCEPNPSFSLDDTWSARLQDYQNRLKASPIDASQADVKKFAADVLPTRQRALTPELLEVFRANKDFLLPAVKTLRKVLDDGSLKIADPGASYQIFSEAGETKVIFTYPMDEDADPLNGRLLLQDIFTLNSADQSFKNYDRQWSVDPQIEPQRRRYYEELLGIVQKNTQTDDARAQQIWDELGPWVFPEPDSSIPPDAPHSSEADFPPSFRRLLRQGKLPADFHSPWEKRLQTKQRLDKASVEGAVEGLGMIHAVASEQLAKRAEESRGWLHSGEPVLLASEQRVQESLFQKATQIAIERNKKSSFAALSALSLTGDEEALRKRILQDPLLKKIDVACQEPQKDMRAQQLILIARQDLLQDEGLAASAVAWAEQLKDNPAVRKEALTILGLFNGSGSAGNQLEFLIPQFSKEVTRPSSLISMAGAGLAGPFLELQGVRALGRFGMLGRTGASFFGVVGEGAVFTTLHDGFQAMHRDPEKAFENWGGETLSTAMLFGATRLVHHGSEGLWKMFGGANNLPAKLVTGFSTHALSIATIKWSNELSRILNWLPSREANGRNGLFDAMVTYFQAMAGFKLASGLTNGALERQIARFKFYQQNFGKGKAKPYPKMGIPEDVETETTAVEELPAKFFSEKLPDLVMMSPAGEAEPLELQLKPGVGFPLDRYFFTESGNRIQLMKTGEQIHLWDNRTLKSTAMKNLMLTMIGINMSESIPFQLNGKQVPTQQWIPLTHGDHLEYVGTEFWIQHPEKSPAIKELRTLPRPQQETLAEMVLKAKNPEELYRDLKQNFPAHTQYLVEAIQRVFQGQESLSSLPVEMHIQSRVRRFLEKNLEASKQRGFEENDFKLRANFDPRMGKLEQAYQKSLVWETLVKQVSLARNLADLRTVIASTPLEEIEYKESAALARKIGEIEHRNGNEVQDLPCSAGIRQKVRDLLEQEWFRKFYGKTSLETARTVTDLSLMRNLLEMEKWKATIYGRLDPAQRVRGAAHAFEAVQLQEAIYQVIERGKPLALVTEAEGFRQAVRDYQARVVDIAERLFNKEMQVGMDPFTGEKIQRDGPESRYRLALHLLNAKGAKPIRGLPSPREISQVVSIVRRNLNQRIPDDYLAAQGELRRQLDQASPMARAMLALASPADKVAIVDAYFGNYRRRDMPAPVAFQLSVLMGQAGIYREVGLTYQIRGDQMRSTFSLGDLSFVAGEGWGDFFLMHSHPEEYLTPDGRIMGAGGMGGAASEGLGRTMAFGVGEQVNPDTRNILPSEQDIKIFVEEARSYWNYGYTKKFGNTPLYDAKNRIFKNWVFNSFGSSEMLFHMSPEGKVEKVVIRYAFREEGFFKDGGYFISMQRLKHLSKEMNLPIEFEKVSAETLAQDYPFAVQGFY